MERQGNGWKSCEVRRRGGVEWDVMGRGGKGEGSFSNL
jgi:hypothetical protein